MAPSAMKLPTWYRAFAILVGVISIALALIVLVEPLLALWLLIFLLAFALLVIGMDRLVAGITGHPFGAWVGPLGPVRMGGPGAGETEEARTPSLPPSKP